MSERNELMDEASMTADPQAWAMNFAEFVAANADKMELGDIVTWFAHAMEAARAHQWEADSRELLGVQEMLGHVIEAAGNNVAVTREQMDASRKRKREIVIDDAGNAFVFRVENK